eukprot:9396002-Pyramimonas_sp.AAC.1
MGRLTTAVQSILKYAPLFVMLLLVGVLGRTADAQYTTTQQMTNTAPDGGPVCEAYCQNIPQTMWYIWPACAGCTASQVVRM